MLVIGFKKELYPRRKAEILFLLPVPVRKLTEWNGKIADALK